MAMTGEGKHEQRGPWLVNQDVFHVLNVVRQMTADIDPGADLRTLDALLRRVGFAFELARLVPIGPRIDGPVTIDAGNPEFASIMAGVVVIQQSGRLSAPVCPLTIPGVGLLYRVLKELAMVCGRDVAAEFPDLMVN